MNIDGSGLIRLTDAGQGNYGHPAWSPDGSRIVCHSVPNIIAPPEDQSLSQASDCRVGSSTAHIFTLNADGTGMLDISSSYDMQPDWTWVTCRKPAATVGAAASITSSGARLKGNLASIGTAPAVFVTFQYGTSSGLFTQETSVQTLTGAATFNASISGLTANTTYYIRVKAVGNGVAYSSMRSFKTSR